MEERDRRIQSRLDRQRELAPADVFNHVHDFALSHTRNKETLVGVLDDMRILSSHLSGDNEADCNSDTRKKRIDLSKALTSLISCEYDKKRTEDHKMFLWFPQHQGCPDFDLFQKSVGILATIALSTQDYPALYVQMLRFLRMFSDETGSAHEMLETFRMIYDYAEGERTDYSSFLPHLTALCDLYEGLGDEERMQLNNEVLVRLTEPSAG